MGKELPKGRSKTDQECEEAYKRVGTLLDSGVNFFTFKHKRDIEVYLKDLVEPE